MVSGDAPVKGDSSDVHVGADGWLFLTGGNNSAINLYKNDGNFDAAKAQQWISLLMQRQQRALRSGVSYFHLVVPEKLTLYADKCRLDGIDLQNSALRRHLEGATKAGFQGFVDCLSPMLDAKNSQDLYYHTDTHWNYQGCICAYLALCKALHSRPIQHLLDAPFDKAMLTLDLGSKLPDRPLEEFRVYKTHRNAQRVFANRIVEFKEQNNRQNEYGLHVGSNVVFRNENPDVDERKLIIFGDSFSEYRRHLLTGILAETFRETHFVWSTSIDWQYVEEHKPNILLTEIAERYLATLPSDDFSLSAYTEDKMSQFI